MNNINFKYKNYAHFDSKKSYKTCLKYIKNKDCICKHGFYLFIHFQMRMKKHEFDHENNTVHRKDDKVRDIYYSAHMDRYIYEYYGAKLNYLYDKMAEKLGINEVAIAYRDNLKGKCNIHFAKEVIDFISNQKEAYIYIADFTSFFENLDHIFLKEKLCNVYGEDRLTDDQYAVFKSITNYVYINKEDILKELKMGKNKFKKQDIIFKKPKEFREFKKKGYLHKHKDESPDKGIPQGSAISSVYANVYMIDCDKEINDYVKLYNGIYRRYCDDIIIIIPKDDTNINFNEFLEKITKIFQKTKNLNIKKEKTNTYIYTNKCIFNYEEYNLYGNENIKPKVMNYLGFSFDGKIVKIRDRSLSKFYKKMYRKINIANFYTDKYGRNVFRKRLYKYYSHLGNVRYVDMILKDGERKKVRFRGGFLRYADKAHKIFSESDNYISYIDNQIKRHWIKIYKGLNKI